MLLLHCAIFQHFKVYVAELSVSVFSEDTFFVTTRTSILKTVGWLTCNKYDKTNF